MKKYSTVLLRAALPAIACLALIMSGAPSALAQDIDACLSCHQDQNLTKKDAAGKAHSLYVDKDLYLKSTHAGLSCVDCHEGAQAKKHPAGGLKDVQCADCHDEAAAKYSASPHGKLAKSGNPSAPKCQDCHTEHAVMKAGNPAASISPDNLHATCGACHEEQAKQALIPLMLDFAKGKAQASAFSVPVFASQIATRVKGHGKDNLAYTYSTRECSNCHIDQVNHGSDTLKAAVCYSCHGQQKPGIIFGKIHKADVVTNPFLSVLLVLAYIAALAGLVFYFKPAVKKDDPPAES